MISPLGMVLTACGVGAGLILLVCWWDIYGPRGRYYRAIGEKPFIEYFKAVKVLYELKTGIPNKWHLITVPQVWEHYRVANSKEQAARELAKL